jgi:hypothetical protein
LPKCDCDVVRVGVRSASVWAECIQIAFRAVVSRAQDQSCVGAPAWYISLSSNAWQHAAHVYMTRRSCAQRCGQADSSVSPRTVCPRSHHATPSLTLPLADADEPWVPVPPIPHQAQMYVPAGLAAVLQTADGEVPAPQVPVPAKVEVSDAADMLLALSGGQQDPAVDPSLDPSKGSQMPSAQVPPAPQVPQQVRCAAHAPALHPVPCAGAVHSCRCDTVAAAGSCCIASRADSCCCATCSWDSRSRQGDSGATRHGAAGAR